MRYKSLDSLRGIAALVVVLHHCSIALFGLVFPNWIRYTPLRVVMDGKGAVLVFFALSGFVLFLSIVQARHFVYLAYLCKRFMRLYVPFAFAVVCSALLYLAVDPHVLPILGPINRFWWQVAPSLGLVLGHLAMTDLDHFQGLDAVMWSLCHEARISLIFPFLAFAVTRNWRWTAGTGLVVSIASAVVVQNTNFSWPYNPFLTLQYLFLFIGAATIASHSKVVARWIAHSRPWVRASLWTFALVAVTLSLNPRIGFVADFAAIALVALSFSDPVAVDALSHDIPCWLGRVSYSLYLIHVPIILTLVHVFNGMLPLPAILSIGVLLSLGLSEVTHRLVEMPSIELGRRLATSLEARRASLRAAPLS